MNPLITCHCCKGKGKRSLPAELMMSYIALRGLKRTTVADFSESLGVELTNAHHRMKRLVKLGVARKVSQKMPAEYEAN